MPDNTDLTPAEIERIAALKAKRIAEDIDMMNSPARWPDLVLHLKTQPWIEPRKFGFINEGSLNVILKDSGGQHECRAAQPRPES